MPRWMIRKHKGMLGFVLKTAYDPSSSDLLPVLCCFFSGTGATLDAKTTSAVGFKHPVYRRKRGATKVVESGNVSSKLVVDHVAQKGISGLKGGDGDANVSFMPICKDPRVPPPQDAFSPDYKTTLDVYGASLKCEEPSQASDYSELLEILDNMETKMALNGEGVRDSVPSDMLTKMAPNDELENIFELIKVHASLVVVSVKLEDLLSKLGTFHSHPPAPVVFLGALNQNSVHPLDALENTVFHRERAARMYLLLPYALAQSGESAGVDSSIFTKTCVDSAGSEGLKDHSAIDRWQSQAATADFDFFNRLHVMDEEDSNINLKAVMEQTIDVEKAMAVFEFLDFKRKNKIPAFVDRLIERHMAMKTDTISGGVCENISIGVEYQKAILGYHEVTLGSSS
ncbi:hypothetical protein Tco_1263449 [Tanacetum coccineum]